MAACSRGYAKQKRNWYAYRLMLSHTQEKFLRKLSGEISRKQKRRVALAEVIRALIDDYAEKRLTQKGKK